MRPSRHGPWVPPDIVRVLDARGGPALEPIRSEIFGTQRLREHARSLAAAHATGMPSLRQSTFYPRLQDNIRLLRRAHAAISAQSLQGQDLGLAAAWLFDNFHLIEAQLDQIHEGLPSRFYRSLPVLQGAPLAGLPRIYGVAWAFVAHTDSAFDETLLLQFLDAYQDERELRQGELWALPTTLRVVLVENLRRLADRVTSHRAAHELATLCAHRITTLPLAELKGLHELTVRRGVADEFLVHLAQCLVGRPPAAAHTPLAQARDWLHAERPELASVQAQQHAAQAADLLSVGNAVTALRLIGAADWDDLVARSSRVVGVLLASPVFAAEDDHTRNATLHGIERLAAQSSSPESAVARALMRRMQGDEPLAAHWLQGEGLTLLRHDLGLPRGLAARWHRLRTGSATPLYLLVLLAGTGLLVAGVVAQTEGAPLLARWLAALLALWPASEAVVAVANRLVSESVKPQHLPGLLLAGGIPASARVLVVIPALLVDDATTAALVHRLHQHHLANPEPHAQFALLTDWADAPTAQVDGDDARLAFAQTALKALNARHPVPANEPARFLLLHRARSWSPTQRSWIGWERKRGKLEQLVGVLATGNASPFFALGALSACAVGTRYLLTLDSDTVLPPGRLRALVGVAEHPQNRPHLDAGGRRVVQGFGIVQPRLVAPLPTDNRTSAWAWLGKSGQGLDPYSAMASDLYQDLFAQGSFTGKGLLNVSVVHAVLGGRLPPETVLSHDLLEGALVRCAVVSDITLLEPEPAHADAHAARLHRWVRGDWQLLPVLLAPGRWPMAAINRWKLIDNLRRSLVAPASLALLVLAIAGQGMALPWALALVLAALGAGPVMGALAAAVPHRMDRVNRRFLRCAAIDLLRAVLAALWQLVMLPSQALSASDAVLRTLYRLSVSRRHLLAWTTADAAQGSLRTTLWGTLLRHRGAMALVLSVVLLWAPGFGLWGGTPQALAWALLTVWALGPLALWALHRPLPSAEERPLRADDRSLLEGLARDTWRMFERCVNAENRHLPPDNLQTLPEDAVAHRTSPTNIGLYLLGAVSARAFGWVGTQELLQRLESTLTTLNEMERHRGHFYNWYDTQTLRPLLPRYVSTVDSGNLSTHLLAVAQACLERAADPLDTAPAARALALSRARVLGQGDALQALLHRPPAQSALGRLLHLPPERLGDEVELLREASAELGVLALQSTPLHAGPPATPPAPGARDTLRWQIGDHLAEAWSAARDQRALRRGDRARSAQRLRAVAGAFQRIAWQADLRFLYHPRRRLLHIGYRPDEHLLDPAFYDLLASEARTTSLLAIAKGDVPPRHWQSLGRPWFASGPHAVLRSWSGSMFEYLMPLVVSAVPRGSALHEAARSALREQRDFGELLGIPWGMSECAHAGRDSSLAYQYGPQGVPRLALRRTPVTECVVAPYATVLATQVDARAACDNLRRLIALGARGRYGLLEALDHSGARQTQGSAFTLVSTFMAHHQGMSVAALANVLLGGVVQRWGAADEVLQSVASLLHEQAPRNLPSRSPQALPPPPAPGRDHAHIRRLLPGAQALEPTHLLGNGRYNVTLRANGAGTSRWGQAGITRWRDDALRDEHGSFLYLRAPASAAVVSLTSHPAPDAAARYSAAFHADRVCFEADWPTLHALTTVWVSPEDDIELRKVVLSNTGGEAITLELISAMDITLAPPAADEAHPAFSNLFVRAEWWPAQQALRLERAPRLATERALLAAHFIASVQGDASALCVQTDRLHWRGRGRPASHPLARLEPAPERAGPLDTGLDPVAALGLTLRLEPGAQATVVFATAAGDNADTLAAVIDKHRQGACVERSSVMSATLAAIPVSPLRPHNDHQPALHALSTALLFTLPRVQALPVAGDPARVDPSLLWPLGLSGERPLLLVNAAAAQGMGLLRLMVVMLREWARAGLGCDLVVLSREALSYDMPLQRELLQLREQHLLDLAHQGAAASTSLHVLRASDLDPDTLATMHALARVTLQADGRALMHQVRDWCLAHEIIGASAQPAEPVPVHTAFGAPDAALGAFADAGARFHIDVSARRQTPRPWVNVLANPGFGAIVSESGAGNTWALNSRLNQLTPWANDPVADPPGEWWLLQDRRSREVWSLAPSAWARRDTTYRVTHTQGITTIGHHAGALAVSVHWCVDAHSAVKQVRITLDNRGPGKLHLRLAGMVEWLLGEKRAHRATLHTQARSEGAAPGLLCTQTGAAPALRGGTAFFCEVPPHPAADAHGEGPDWTCDRRAFFGPHGELVLPLHLGQRAGAGLDACGAHARLLTLRPGAVLEQVYLIGYAESPDAARALMDSAAAVDPHAREQAVRERWLALTGAVQVRTPDPLFDALVNRWLPYQTVSSRLWAKAGFYQAGGATGYRDQLQDTMALVWAEPALLRAQIVLCASRQFEAGDVQHWWHEPGGAGVRTHFCDDLLWLPYALAHYRRCTGDDAVLDERVPFLDAPPLAPGAEDAYDTPRVSSEWASVYEHAARTIDHSLRTGAHGLPLMGTGDWNDGMNRVGHEGRGESVWLAWFLCAIVRDWIPLARERGEQQRAERWSQAQQGWAAALQTEAWDGAWYRRAFFDDGSPLGSNANGEARIDLIAQAWAVLSEQAPPERQAQAMAAVRRELLDEPAGLLRLLVPALQRAEPSAGYIQAYPPGVRENGGQYAHAAVWALMATARLAREQGPEAPARAVPYQDFCRLSPAHRAAHPDWGPVYALEPYAMAADVYGAPPWVGRGGWSWYTGAAGWLHRAAIESVFGLQLRASELWFLPCLPPHWDSAELTLRRSGRALHFRLRRASAPAAVPGETALAVGECLAWGALPQGSRFVLTLD